MVDLFDRQLKALADEKGLSKEDLLVEVEQALATAYKKFVGATTDISVRLHGQQIITVQKEVVSVVQQSYCQIALTPDTNLGDLIEVNVALGDFGKIAANAFKQVLHQRLLAAEYDHIQAAFNKLPGDVALGKVIDDRVVVIDKIECDLREPTAAPSGTDIYVYVLRIERSRNTTVFVSWADRKLPVGLLRLQAPDIEVLGAAREPGLRSKVVVRSLPRIDLGLLATQAGEVVDVVEWSPDREVYIGRLLGVKAKVEGDIVTVDNVPKALGTHGSNIKCVRKILGPIEVRKS